MDWCGDEDDDGKEERDVHHNLKVQKLPKKLRRFTIGLKSVKKEVIEEDNVNLVHKMEKLMELFLSQEFL